MGGGRAPIEVMWSVSTPAFSPDFRFVVESVTERVGAVQHDAESGG